MATTSWGPEVRTAADGLWLGEGPRWHDGSLWCSDIHGHQVLRLDLDASGGADVHVVVEIPDDDPSGLGWLADGRLLVAGMQRKVVYRVEADGSLRVHADLSGVARGVLNDMIVDARGRAYVGDMGMDPNDHTIPMQPGQLVLVEPDGSFRSVADELGAPNGPALTDDGGTLVLAESSAFQLSVFDVQPDGSLSNRRIFATVPAAPDGPGFAPPDGICLDAEGAAWVADPIGGRVIRLMAGELTHVIDYHGEAPVACVLGGEGRRTLFVCVGPEYQREAVLRAPLARVDAVEVDLGGAGRP